MELIDSGLSTRLYRCAGFCVASDSEGGREGCAACDLLEFIGRVWVDSRAVLEVWGGVA